MEVSVGTPEDSKSSVSEAWLLFSLLISVGARFRDNREEIDSVDGGLSVDVFDIRDALLVTWIRDG